MPINMAVIGICNAIIVTENARGNAVNSKTMTKISQT